MYATHHKQPSLPSKQPSNHYLIRFSKNGKRTFIYGTFENQIIAYDEVIQHLTSKGILQKEALSISIRLIEESTYKKALSA